MQKPSLFANTNHSDGIYVMLLINRLQILYFILIMPAYLAEPYMVWVIIAVGLLSQLLLTFLSKWFSSRYPAMGYEGFTELLGERKVRLLAGIGIIFIFIKMIVITIGSADIIHQFVFPSMDRGWLILFPIIVSLYMASQGMGTTIRFIPIMFLSSIWILFLFGPFYLTEAASLRDLYPIVPTEWTVQHWKAPLFLLSALSGPEYLVCLVPWLRPERRPLTYLTIANTFSIVEYILIFIATLLFYGSGYIRTITFPILNMGRYVQFPFFERIDVLLVSCHMIIYIYILSLLLLCFYGALRIVAGKQRAMTSRLGLIACWVLVTSCMLIIEKWFWKVGALQKFWLELQMAAGATTYILVPVVLAIAVIRKRRIV
ncbi:GerAB/ArcD/ProY family transporter [Paenibacillus sp. sgz302251]|uniref:GerAB/ArcD/ProY family transporter n=1 Tax=Paenibacillus sp. sgz302251 TaxID=3414493 RepID=UPI003C7AEB9B